MTSEDVDHVHNNGNVYIAFCNDVTKREKIDDEQKGAKDSSLGNTTAD